MPVKDYIVVRETAEGKVMVPGATFADPQEATAYAQLLCVESKQVIKVYGLEGIAKSKKVWPVTMSTVKQGKGK
jgi:hypothetical protein